MNISVEDESLTLFASADLQPTYMTTHTATMNAMQSGPTENVETTIAMVSENNVQEVNDTNNTQEVHAVKRIVEGLLLVANEPLSLDYLYKLLRNNNLIIEKNKLREVIEGLAHEYCTQRHAMELKEVASGYRIQVGGDLAPWISALLEEKPPRYSRSFLETLVIIAYKQPLTRAEIEQIRGVGVSSNTIKVLLDHDWIKIVGYKEVPGRPMLYATTSKFMDHFNLKSLEELPQLEEFKELSKDQS